MSYQENINLIETLRTAIQSYRGFTKREKAYAVRNLHIWIKKDGSFNTLIKKFSEISIDIKPFLFEERLIRI
jgi:hypothetical protein